MIARTLIATALLGAAVPAFADQPSAPPGETNIPRMSAFLEWVADGEQALFIRGDTGRWYHARLQAPCPRLDDGPGRIRFEASPGNRFDRNSTIRADGWRCLVASVTDSTGPAPRRQR